MSLASKLGIAVDDLLGRRVTASKVLESDGSWGEAHQAFLRVRANSIEGGTSEIMRNILGEQVLGLPGEPRLDKDVAWAQVPRS